jgi:preprotein translocase subunit Sec63
MTGTVEQYLRELGLASTATPEEIREAYRDLSKVWHPDRFGHDPKLRAKADERLKAINDAYAKLKDYTPPPAKTAAGRPHAGGARIISPRRSFMPKDRMWIVAVALAALVTLLLVLTAL